MEFRPCIDIHNGKVKQIIGSSLHDSGDSAEENFVSDKDASYYAGVYRRYGLRGGHVIILNSRDSEYYDKSRRQAESALKAYPNGMDVGGGIDSENAGTFIDAGAAHVIVTSYVFSNGNISYERLEKLRNAAGKEHIVLDLSCRRRGEEYYIVTDRWQRFTEEILSRDILNSLEKYCDEYLIHAADVEGKNSGIERDVITMLAGYDGNKVTYAGGVHSYQDIDTIGKLGNGRVNVTVGSSLNLFGGDLDMDEIIRRTGSYPEG